MKMISSPPPPIGGKLEGAYKNNLMKKIFVIVFLCFAVTVSAQNIPAEDTTAKPAIAAIGKPDGEKTEMKIGKDGGSFISSDGKVRLIIPEGTVSKKTTFSIQPTTNLMPNGNGKAYQMEPSGIIFQKPIQLIFSYNDNETEGNSALLLGLAMQDEKGKWSSLKKAILDSVAKTLTADIHHFSSYVNFRWAKIYPSSARVKVNGSLRLNIRVLVPLDEDGEGDELSSLGGVEKQQVIKWSVNNIPKGNSTVGLVSVSENNTAIYQAPRS